MRPAALILVFLLGLGLGMAGLRQLALRNPSASGGMLEHLAAHGDEYDVLVVGPSFVRMHFLPPVFERRLRERGHKLRAFGFGLSGLRGGEFDYYLSRVLELPMPRLKWVLCDVSLDQLRPLEEGNWYKRRLIQWHAPAQFMFMQRAIMAGEGTLEERLVYVSRHARHALLNLGNVGEGVEAVHNGAWLGETARVRSRSSFHQRRPSERKLEKSIRKYMRHARVHKNKVKRLAKLRKKDPKHPRPNDMIVSWRDRIRDRGLEPVFVLSPLLSDARMVTEVAGDAPLRVLDFDDPRRYPELYEPELRYNPSHFNYIGAERFSIALADAFADLIEAGTTERAVLDSKPAEGR